jgi:hypothetical protein
MDSRFRGNDRPRFQRILSILIVEDPVFSPLFSAKLRVSSV